MPPRVKGWQTKMTNIVDAWYESGVGEEHKVGGGG